ncbi:STM3941 family protein [Myceligenerans pegani]|uniref:Uncharacterized protein n=1 Tax=Myceligenerans pegani TaxID=2776917 RepID=A0ABR9MXQ8_9MICO|nr:STM3941 family protein [Myceligenerans sp. TRM 65318]MBE1876169.1 hypothetical protein [Myceligenerans sp. TRM 65318]MBE3018440.1 hypothetical protein [Myceligenerans sp. TRM 65318]
MSDAMATDQTAASTSTGPASPATGDVVELFPSRGHVATLAIAALVLAVVCGAAAVIGFDSAQATPSPTALVVTTTGAVGVLMALGAGLIAVRRMLVARWPVLIVDDEGFTDWLPNLGVERVEWSEVTGIRDASLAGRAVVAIDVTDPDAVVERQRTAVRRFAAATNQRLAGTPVVLKPGSIDASAEQIKAALAPYVATRSRE